MIPRRTLTVTDTASHAGIICSVPKENYTLRMLYPFSGMVEIEITHPKVV